MKGIAFNNPGQGVRSDILAQLEIIFHLGKFDGLVVNLSRESLPLPADLLVSSRAPHAKARDGETGLRQALRVLLSPRGSAVRLARAPIPLERALPTCAAHKGAE